MKNETTMLRTEPVTTEAEEDAPAPERKGILLADDDAAVRESIARVLESEGYDVLLARNGYEAIARFVDLKPHLVLLDLIMFGKDGWSTFTQMERLDPFVPVIVITALPNQFARANSLGIDAIMEKPLDLPLLLKTIKQLLAEPMAQRVERLTKGDFNTVNLSASRPHPSGTPPTEMKSAT
jgi:DNA-binding response OmpR family regulator